MINKIVEKIIRRGKNKYIINKAKKRLQNDTFSIISQNCIGGVFYHDMDLKFLSPTINLYFEAVDFVKFASNLKYYVEAELVCQLDEQKGYPIGILEDIKIHFLHYNACEEAQRCWNSRKERIVFEKILVLSTDRDGFNDDLYEKWKQLPYEKLLFTSQKKYSDNEDSIYFAEYENNGTVPDLIPKREFYKEDKLVNHINKVKVASNKQRNF